MINRLNLQASAFVVIVAILVGLLFSQNISNKDTIQQYVEASKVHEATTRDMQKTVDSLMRLAKSSEDSAKRAAVVTDSLSRITAKLKNRSATQIRSVQKLQQTLDTTLNTGDSVVVLLEIVDSLQSVVLSAGLIIHTMDEELTLERNRARQLEVANRLQSLAVDSLKTVIATIPRLKDNPNRIIFDKIPLPSRVTSFGLGAAAGAVATAVIVNAVK